MIFIKRVFSVLIIFLILFSGCGNNKSEISDYPLDESKYKMSDKLLDATAALNGTVIDFPLSYKEFTASGFSLSKSDKKEKLKANQYSIYKVNNGVSVIGVYIANLTYKEKDLDDCTVCGISADAKENTAVELAGKVKLNKSTEKEIIKAYTRETTTEKAESFDKCIKYGKGKNCAELFINDGILSKVNIYKICDPALESFSKKIPDAVKKYKAPDSLSDNLKDFTFYLYGKTYTMPLPVRQLLKHGWINAYTATDYVAPGQTVKDAIKLTCSNRTVIFSVKNMADYTTTVKNCFIVSVKSTSDVKLDMTLAGGVRVGSYTLALFSVFPKKAFTNIVQGRKTTKYIYVCSKGKLTVSASKKSGYITKIMVEMN